MSEIQKMIEDLVERAKVAREEYSKLTQEEVDRIVKQMAMAVLENHMMLARLAVDETKRGIYEDKITKNIFASEYIYHSIKNSKTVGIIQDNEEDGYEEIAEPVGIIAGITPVTNPTSTVMSAATGGSNMNSGMENQAMKTGKSIPRSLIPPP